MGAGQSSTQFATPPSRALHVLRVTPESPASKTTIEPLFDFVVGFEGDSLASQNNIDAVVLERIVEGHEGRTLNLLVWNTKNQQTRVVPIVPSRAWSLPSSESEQEDGATQPSLLGLSMRMCEPEFAMDNVWHVLDVLEGSPAESAGLVPYGDYITGWSGGVLSVEGDFYDLVEAHVDKPLRVYVYSHDFDALREVVLVPNRQWGGEGLLGCVFGYGLLHRIPPQPVDRIAGSSTPPELQEHPDEYEEQELFVPADIPSESQYVPSQLADWRKQQEPYRYNPVPPIQEEEGQTISNTERGHHDHDHDHQHGHDHDHQHDGHGHDHPEAPPPGPPRRTSSLNTSSSLRSSRVHTASPTPPAFSVPGRVSSSSYLNTTLNGPPKRVAMGDEGSDGSAADTDTDRGSLTSVD
ncbi:GRASP55/65 PDZ-like domain-containing protein [Mycena rosella]|uniref:GRASP55/65 PDZ-like domain-containing protein n=1 Tax=Mycena rosella TaxID=1033263 RepID=A0AAD7GNF9_MYCRO|nr:GRASP55/65 PDZ-like domain-containing protein [Mycena rosella]